MQQNGSMKTPNNYKLKMNPHTIDFSKSPISPKKYTAAKRKILGDIQVPKSPLERLKSSSLTMSPRPNSLLTNHNIQNINSPLLNTNSPALIKKHSPTLNKGSPLSSRSKRSRISKVMEERSKFKSSNKENDPPLMSETFVKLDDDEEARDFLFAKKFEAVWENFTNWSTTKLDFSDTPPQPEDEKEDVYVPEKEEIEDVYLPEKEETEDVYLPEKQEIEDVYLPEKQEIEDVYLPEKEETEDVYVPEKEITQDEDDDCETLHDLEEEFDANFDECTKYEIISTDSPNIISRGRTATTRKVTARNFDFGAPLAENEPSTSFDIPNITVTRMLTFEEEDFEAPLAENEPSTSFKYEIISTDSPNIISRGRTATTRKVTARNFDFGAPLAENEPSTSFDIPNITVTRMLTFEEEDFEAPLAENEPSTSFEYEIISTDSPNIISRGRTATTRKVTARNFDFGAPLAENEPSTSFDIPNITVARMLTFEEEDFEAPLAENEPSTSFKYEIISTDSPNIISRGRTATTRKVTARNFDFGAPLAENEPSTSFDRPNITVTRMLTIEEEDFEAPLAENEPSTSFKYEIISTDSPNIISRGRTATTRKVTARNFDFGAPLAENEPSTSFEKPNITVARMLTFEEEDFEAPLAENEPSTSFKYEIISTDSPNIISRGRTATTRKVTARNFDFGAPLAENEPSTSFDIPNITVTRMLTFEEEDFEAPLAENEPSTSFERPNITVARMLTFEEEDFEAPLAENEPSTSFKYEIISTDSPNIISRGRTATTRKVTARNFDFGAPLAENEPSTSFDRPNITVTRMLTIEEEDFEAPLAENEPSTSFYRPNITVKRMLTFEEEDFEFTSPAVKKAAAKKSLKFSESSTKLKHEKSDSSIGSMHSSSQASPKASLYTSESTTSMESGFISEMEEPFLEIEESNSPKVENFNVLLSGLIKTNVVTNKSFLRRPLNRSLIFKPDSNARVSLSSILENPEKRNYKRVERTETAVANKRRKSGFASPSDRKVAKPERPVLLRAQSENNAMIMQAMDRSQTIPDLIGDFSVPFALPLTDGDHCDLKSISCETLAKLLKGEFNDTIGSFQVIDCRYPYEYEGGHVVNALNYYTQEQIQKLLDEPVSTNTEDNKRRILVFHCEFSVERGPKLSRFLRSTDRACNSALYPRLQFPELYLLHSGYRAFYRQFPELCRPRGYTAMRDPRHSRSLRLHRDKH